MGKRGCVGELPAARALERYGGEVAARVARQADGLSEAQVAVVGALGLVDAPEDELLEAARVVPARTHLSAAGPR